MGVGQTGKRRRRRRNGKDIIAAQGGEGAQHFPDLRGRFLFFYLLIVCFFPCHGYSSGESICRKDASCQETRLHASPGYAARRAAAAPRFISDPTLCFFSCFAFTNHRRCAIILFARGISAAGSAPQWHCGGHRFDSDMLHFKPRRVTRFFCARSARLRAKHSVPQVDKPSPRLYK